MEEPNDKPVGGSGCLLRLYWMFCGNAILLFPVVSFVENGIKFPSWLDLVYWITVITLIAARYIDIRYEHGQTADGKPASMSDFRRYVIILAIVSVAVWALAFIRR